MPTNDDSSDFDSLDDESAPIAVAAAAKPGDFWRQGHRRPWWQWNVITLFVSLFVLVWVRELARISQTATWMICLALFSVWALAPALALEWRPSASPNQSGYTAGRVVAYLGSLAILVGIMALPAFISAFSASWR